MSFVNKIKGWGQKGGADTAVLDSDVAVADDYSPGRGSASHPATDLPLADVEAAAAFDAMPQAGDGAPAPTSIISESTPSESADFTETRLQDADTGAAPLGAALPLIGDRPAAEQQRIFSPGRKRRVVIATNVAETSITIPRIRSGVCSSNTVYVRGE